MRWTDVQLFLARQTYAYRFDAVENYLAQRSRLSFTARHVLKMSAIDLCKSSSVAQSCKVSRQRVSAILKDFSMFLMEIRK
jgi:hypothetical protein